MNYSDPKKLAFGIALLIVAFFTVAYVSLAIIFELSIIYTYVATSILMLLFVYFLLDFSIRRFIYEKIKIIYKTIHLFQVSKGKDDNSPINESLDDVNKQVIEWGDEQQKEIDNLKELAAYRREFLGNVSHELKTPIFNIQGYVLTLLDGGLSDPKINKKYLIRTEKSINRMIAIVEDLEDISQLESGELKLDLSSFNIVELAREIIDFMEIKAKKKNIIIEFDKSYDRPIMVTADKKRIRQVLINLIDNAIKYCKEDSCFTRISFFDVDKNVLMEISDNGLGIDQENIPRIFERFYRTDKGRSREQGGTGLGLAIVKHIIEAHGQAINVRSTLGVGTTFGFTLKKD
jgi:two-component system phosphate regulon sensor histidine kinase PhoR